MGAYPGQRNQDGQRERAENLTCEEIRNGHGLFYLAERAALGRTEIYLRMSGRVNRLYYVPGRGRFTSYIVYLGDNSRWKRYPESSAKSTGFGV